MHRVELDMLIAEVEALVNSCPLTYVSVESLPLIPSALLGNVWSNTAPEHLELQDAPDFRRQYSYVVGKMDELKKRWQEEYLLQLRTFQLGRNKPVRVNDVVLQVESNKRHQFWRLGRVQQLFRWEWGECVGLGVG